MNMRPGFRGLSPSVTVTPANIKSRSLGPVTITPRLAPANFPGMTKSLEQNKDKPKIENKSEAKSESGEKFESDDGQSSNSSLDVASTSSKQSSVSDSVPHKGDDKTKKEKGKEVPQGISEDGGFGLTLNLSDQSKSDGSENRSVDGHSDSSNSAGNHQALSSQHRLQPQHQAQEMLIRTGQNNGGAQSRDSSNANSSSQNPSYSGSNLYSSSEKSSSQSSSVGFSANFSNSSSMSKQYSSNLHGGSTISPANYSTSGDRVLDDPKSSNSIENQWKSPQAPQSFSPGVPSGKSTSQQRSLESPAYDDNSNTSVHSNVSTKSSTAQVSNLESRSHSAADIGPPSLASHSKSSSKSSQPSIPSASNQSSSSSSKINTTANATSSAVPSSSSSSSFPPLDPYTNIYGGYGAYPGSLPSSNYYSPYGYPPGFLPDSKSALGNKSSTESSQSTAIPASRSSSKSSSSRSENKKAAHESSRSSLPTAYDSRQTASSVNTGSSAHSSRSSGSSSSSSASSAAAAASASASSSSAASDTGAYPSSSSAAAAAAAAYNPMMMSPSFNPTNHQYPPPSAASGSANPFTAAAAAAANYPSPYASPYGYPGANQFESDLARASMYSAFHRPDAGLDPTAPYLAIPAHSRPMTGAAPPAGSFYSQNMYGGQYGSARDPYAQLPPYPASPFIMPPAPYGGLASSGSSTATSDQSPSQ